MLVASGISGGAPPAANIFDTEGDIIGAVPPEPKDPRPPDHTGSLDCRLPPTSGPAPSGLTTLLSSVCGAGAV
jgi:hypothetical protein